MALPALDESLANLVTLPKEYLLAKWLAQKTGGNFEDYVTFPEKTLYAKIAEQYSGVSWSSYITIANQYAWGAIYQSLTGEPTNYDWDERLALAFIGAKLYDEIPNVGFFIDSPQRYQIAYIILEVIAK